MNWYCFKQNNSGGSFIVDDKVCNRLFIEAESFDAAVKKAEELGCYWDGVDNGIDCPCCGDRWSKENNTPINLNKYRDEGYVVSTYINSYTDGVSEWNNKYGNYEIVEQPKFTGVYFRQYVGKIRIHGIEQYAQVLTDQYSWTVPDARIYYNDGNIKEIFSTDFERQLNLVI